MYTSHLSLAQHHPTIFRIAAVKPARTTLISAAAAASSEAIAARVGGSRSARLSMLFSGPTQQGCNQHLGFEQVFRRVKLTIGRNCKSENIQAAQENDGVIHHVVKHLVKRFVRFSVCFWRRNCGGRKYCMRRENWHIAVPFINLLQTGQSGIMKNSRW